MTEDDDSQKDGGTTISPSDEGISISPSELDKPRDLRYIRKSFDKEDKGSIEE